MKGKHQVRSSTASRGSRKPIAPINKENKKNFLTIDKKFISFGFLIVFVAVIIVYFNGPDVLKIFTNSCIESTERVQVNDSIKVAGKPSKLGGWRLADDKTLQEFGSEICSIDVHNADELSVKEFETTYRFKKPLIVKFKNGAKDWTDPEKWTVKSLKREYGEWSVLSGNSLEIVRLGGRGDMTTSFSQYVDKFMNMQDTLGEPFYVFDREFYKDSSLPKTLKPPEYFKIQDDVDDSIFFLGGSQSGVSFHKHADAWNGVIYGKKRWFLYSSQRTPPGGVYPGFTQIDWFKKVYPNLTDSERPLECIQEEGDILYLPEGTYHGTINLGDTVAIGIQKKRAVTDTEKLFYQVHDVDLALRNVRESGDSKLLEVKVELFERLLQLLPENAEVHMKAGQMYREMGNYVKARTHTEKAVQLDKHFVVALLNLAGLHFELGDANEADRLYVHAMSLNPYLWDVYAQYGDFLMKSNRPKDAVTIYKKGTEIKPKMLPFWFQLQRAQKAMGDTDAAAQTQTEIDKLRDSK
ncbi:hypothetical protein CHS0354_038494 [Potamilus streckersoni]|uniref:JmjC domain-containing protein n=1 Tax=Potamilus streckersoni TaxID=2493646 RepID=A0AAE0S5U2_9BIVA|nr:hypothetical protein CHS0354_038494 [Potamilus streckersoni]